MNVLVTAAGRRTSLVRSFVVEARARGGRVFAGDVDPLAPALYVADESVELPPTGPGYSEALRRAVELHGIDMVVPTIDTDLPLLAQLRQGFAELGCRLVVSSEPFVATTLDKQLSGVAFASQGIEGPRSWLPPFEGTVELPDQVFVKPRRGSASQHVYQVAREQVGAVLELVPGAIVQEVLRGPEITIDALLDFDGRPIHYVPRRRIRTIGGESVQGVTLDHDQTLEEWIEGVLEACAHLGALGPLTIQAFLTPRGPILSEVNPRFGGGYPLAEAAGARYPAWLLDLAAGGEVAPRLGQYESGLYMTRYLAELFTRQPKW